MAEVIEGFETGSSNLVQGTGTNSATFTMPASVALAVESVIATVDNTSGGDTVAQVTIMDQSGQVIATKRQDDAIPAGDTGTATFALRVDNSGGGIRFNKDNEGGWLYVKANSAGGPDSVFMEFAAGTTQVIIGPVDLSFISAFEFHNALGGIYRFTNSSLFDVAATEVTLSGPNGVSLTSHGAFAQINLAGPTFVQLRVGDVLEVEDHLGNPIFRVNEDGSLQGKTGKALTFNL